MVGLCLGGYLFFDESDDMTVMTRHEVFLGFHDERQISRLARGLNESERINGRCIIWAIDYGLFF